MRNTGPRRTLIAVLLSLVLLHFVLLFPGHPQNLVPGTWARLPLELPAIVLLLLGVNRRMAKWAGVLLVIALILLSLLRLADMGSYLAFNRRFSPLLELHLIKDGWNLASTAIGPLEAGLVVMLVIMVLMALALLLFRCLHTISQLTGQSRQAAFRISGLALLGGSAGLIAGQYVGFAGPLEARVIPEYASRITSINKSIIDQRAFVASLQSDKVLDNATPSFGALRGRDVVLVFVESYGRGYLDAERFSRASHERLDKADQTVRSAGLHARSGWLTSPIRGGRSWLAHSTLQSGLEVSNQARFDRLISTDRQSLTRLFGQAGWRTAGVMPAIQLDWPEGSWYGFDEIYTSSGMQYAGQRFGYVTMPDQYTLYHFDTAIRQPSDKPVMATIALLSTHAPWTPLPRKIDWNQVGDGSVYDGSHRFGDPVRWKFRSKVQDMYEQSFDYTLDILAEYMARSAGDALFIIVGDHQPPPIINGWGKSGDVPVHLVTRDRELLERLPSANWTDGMIPDPHSHSQRMSGFRQTLSTVFESTEQRPDKRQDESSTGTASPDLPQSR